MPYPFTSFSSRNIPHENGGAVYAVWRYLGPCNGEIKGYISRTRRGTWQVDISSRYHGRRVEETPRFADAKRMACRLLE
jgi:hypothetical protein